MKRLNVFLSHVMERYYISIAQNQLRKQVAINNSISSNPTRDKRERKLSLKRMITAQSALLDLEIYKISII